MIQQFWIQYQSCVKILSSHLLKWPRNDLSKSVMAGQVQDRFRLYDQIEKYFVT